MRLSAMRRPRSSHTATLTFTLSWRAFAIAASTIEFASARVSVTTPNILAALPAYLDCPANTGTSASPFLAYLRDRHAHEYDGFHVLNLPCAVNPSGHLRTRDHIFGSSANHTVDALFACGSGFPEAHS